MKLILDGLNQEQKKAVSTTEGPLLIIAGAGTGKTTVITRRIASIIEKKLAKPSEILALTFTEKAAAEMEERVDVLVPYGYIDTWISTFNAFGNRVLQEKAIDIGLPTNFQVLTRPQQVIFFQQNLFAFELAYYRPLSNPTKFIEAILSFISRCKDEDISPDDYKNYVAKLKKTKSSKLEMSKEEWETEIKRQEELAGVYEKYEELKTQAGKLDYGDQVSLTLKLFRTRAQILKEYQEKFKYILVDEFQDTNYAQNELVKLLAKKGKNICVVGDDDQSIYKFRGAAISNILKFKTDFPTAKQIVLTKNYRSTQNLLDSSYKLIRYNDPDRLEVKNKINKKLIAAIGELGEAPQEISCPTLSEETDFVAGEIKKLLTSQKITLKDIAILVRANSQAESFLRALNVENIPYKFSGSSGLYSQPEIGLLISFLNSISNFDDSLSLYDLAVSEIYLLSLRDCIAAMDYSKRRSKTLSHTFRNISKLEDLEISAEGKAIIEKINSDIDYCLELSKKYNVGQILYYFLERSKYLARLEKEASVESEIKIQNIAKFFDKIKEFINLSSSETTRAFVDYLETIRIAGDDPSVSDYDPDVEAVNVMTVHAAKGLEFKVVFMVGLVSDRFPSREKSEIISLPDDLIKEILPSGDFHLQEERRLFYVGSTRAKEKLYYTWSKDQGGKRLKKVSPFILEALERSAEVFVEQRKNALEKINQFLPNSVAKKNSLPQASRKIIELSQGSIDDYETCAYKYRYAHILHLPILRHHAVVYGFALHAAVAEFYRSKIAGKILPLDDVYQTLENTWVNEGFLTAQHEEQRLIQAKEVIRNFWEREKANKENPTFIEKSFKFSLKNGETSVIVSGRYDRVDVKKDKVRIIDYKSTENRTQEELERNAKDSIQLKVYTMAYFKNYQVVPEFVGIYDLATGLVGGYEPKKEDIEKTESEVIEVAKNIRLNLQDDSFPADPKYFGRAPACNYCAYSSICPFSLMKR